MISLHKKYYYGLFIKYKRQFDNSFDGQEAKPLVMDGRKLPKGFLQRLLGPQLVEKNAILQNKQGLQMQWTCE